MATHLSGRPGASRRPGRWEKFCARGAKWRPAGSRDLSRLVTEFVKLDQNLAAIWNGDQEEIYACAVCAGPRGGKNRGDFEFFLQDLRGASDIRAAKLHLLDSFSMLSQKACEHSRATR